MQFIVHTGSPHSIFHLHSTVDGSQHLLFENSKGVLVLHVHGPSLVAIEDNRSNKCLVDSQFRAAPYFAQPEGFPESKVDTISCQDASLNLSTGIVVGCYQ